MKKLSAFFALFGLMLFASATQAAVVQMHATSVIDYDPVGAIDASRMDPTKALGAPQGGNTSDFVSLGFGGSIELGFDLPILASGLLVVETTWGNNTYSSYPESADVFLKLWGESGWTNVGPIFTKGGSIDLVALFGASQIFEPMIRIVDTSPVISGRDGFDVNGITVNGIDVPAPAVLMLMGLGLAGAGLARKRRT